jgi:hypothetical protein
MTTEADTRNRRAVNPALFGVLGMIVVPICIVLETNSWNAPDAAAYIRMALGTVIASTTAVIAAWSLAYNQMRTGARDRYWFWGVAIIFTFAAIASITGAAEKLTQLMTL